MAKHGKVLPARRAKTRGVDDDSILLRSAESIGRVIGTLQRQLEGARGRLSGLAAETGATNNGRNGHATTKRPRTARVAKAAKTARKPR